MTWISVEECLPTVGDYVLVWGVEPRTYGHHSQHVAYIDDDDGNHSDYKWLLENGFRITQVTHWMPLPTAPA